MERSNVFHYGSTAFQHTVPCIFRWFQTYLAFMHNSARLICTACYWLLSSLDFLPLFDSNSEGRITFYPIFDSNNFQFPIFRFQIFRDPKLEDFRFIIWKCPAKKEQCKVEVGGLSKRPTEGRLLIYNYWGILIFEIKINFERLRNISWNMYFLIKYNWHASRS